MSFGKDQNADTSKTRKTKAGPDGAALVHISEKSIKAHQMMADRIDSRMSIPDLAQKYDCSPSTVDNYLAFARNHGLYLDKARFLIENHLLPRALAVYEKYLDGAGRQMSAEAGDDLDAARDVLFGLGALSKSTTVKHTPSDVAETLDSWRQKYFEEEREAVAVLAPATPATPAAIQPPHQDRNEHHRNVAVTHEAEHFPSGRVSDLSDQDHEDPQGLRRERADAADDSDSDEDD